MGARKSSRKAAPALTPEARENQLISHAIDLAERQLIEGTAAAPVITHFLKLASTREKLEQERLHRENLLLSAKVDQLASTERQEQLFAEAIQAFRGYSGQEVDEYDGN